MAVYYYACRLTAACTASRGRHKLPSVSSNPPPPQQAPPVSKQPTPTVKLKTEVVMEGSDSVPGPPPSNETALTDNADRPTYLGETQWKELCYDEGNLVSGRLEALVQHMVPTSEYYPDRAFLFAFLLSSRLFIKPHELLGQVSAAACSQHKEKTKSEEPPAHLIRFLSEWSETFPYDFRDERVMSHVREVAHRCVSVDGPVRQEVSLLLQNLLHRLTKLEQYEAFLHSIHTEQSISKIEALSQTDVSELCGSAVCLAQQLTHIEVERLSYIGPEEFVQAYSVENISHESKEDAKITRNFENYEEWSARLKMLVASDICRMKSKKRRTRTVEFWMETAKVCFDIGNFNSLMAILAGLNFLPVSRLKRTWGRVDKSDLESLMSRLSQDDRSAGYRAILKTVTLSSPNPERHFVPHFAIHLADMHQICQQCLIKLTNGHVNFDKFWQLAKQVTEFSTWKQAHCPFPKQPKVITYLQATAVLNEEAVLLASYECEAPETTEEIEHHKQLLSSLGRS